MSTLPGPLKRRGLRGGWSLAAAVAVLAFALSFENVWPTFAVRPAAAVPIEIVLLLLGFVVLGIFGRRIEAREVTVLAVVLTLLAVGRYAEVTTAALFGRPVHLYFDAPHLPNVFAMLAKVASPWLLGAGAIAVLGAVTGIYIAMRWAVARTAGAVVVRTERTALFVVGLAAATLAVAGEAGIGAVRWSSSVTASALAEATSFVDAMRAERRGELLPPAIELGDGVLAGSGGRDVLVVFAESYGAVAFDRPDLRAALADSRRRFASAVSSSGRGAVSAFVESPTFAGASWLAHASFMTGVRIDNGGAYERLLVDDRDTLPRRFARAGYRTVAVMPGLREAWPEGAFFGFDALYDAAALDYRGPEFGWWRIPDQWALAQMDALERSPNKTSANPRPPLLAFFPTLSTHVPFRPTPPYQPDWSKLATARPFAGTKVDEHLAGRPEWLNLAPAYTDSLRYALEMMAGYLEWQSDDDFVLIMLGDHQPAASITGPRARADVPVHVIAATDAPLFTKLEQLGFEKGLSPKGSAIGEMHELTTWLLDALR